MGLGVGVYGLGFGGLLRCLMVLERHLSGSGWALFTWLLHAFFALFHENLRWVSM